MKFFNTTLLFIVKSSVLISANSMPSRERYPQVISHRGASGYVPEHSIPAYQLAIDLGTDYIEPDLCLSKDGIFVAMHDLMLDDTTNVADLPEFNDKKTTKIVDGSPMTGYFVSDFTLAELLTLRLKQRLAGRTTVYDGIYQIPTVDDIYKLLQQQYAKSNRTVGMYAELKHPGYHNSIGFKMEDMLLESLKTSGGYKVSYTEDVPKDLKQVLPVVIQCFEATSLQYLHTKTSIPLVQLLEATTKSYWTTKKLEEISSYAQAVGPDKTFFETTTFVESKKVVDMIHTAELSIHPWTFRADYGVSKKFESFADEEMYFYCCLGVDALFSEFPDQSRETVDSMLLSQTSGENKLLRTTSTCNNLCV